MVARRRAQAPLPHHRLQARQEGHPGKVSTIEYDPNRSARIALVTYADGEKRYILQPLGHEGRRHHHLGRQRRHPAGQLPAAEEHPARHDGAQRRAKPGKGGQMARSAGAAVQVVAKEGDTSR